MKSPAQPVPEVFQAALRALGLGEAVASAGEALTGGVSSDIWRIDLPSGPVCAKRALAQLRVAAEWHAPIERSRYEARWMQLAHEAVEGSAPRVLGQHLDSGVLVMSYLAADAHPLWKSQLRDGHADPAAAAAVGDRLGRIHAYCAARPGLAAKFDSDPIFFDIRLEPYLVATGRRHPDLQARLLELVGQTQRHRKSLVHGDVSPKNILIGPAGPVFLDAECAWWGDPAFDLAFCLNHLLLKCLWNPGARPGYHDCFAALHEAYRARIDWEAASALLGRVAALLPGLMLARIDGKSPVEYITSEADRDRVRRFTREHLLAPVSSPLEVQRAWIKELAR